MESNLTQAWTKEFPHAAPQIQHLLVTAWARCLLTAKGSQVGNESKILVDIS